MPINRQSSQATLLFRVAVQDDREGDMLVGASFMGALFCKSEKSVVCSYSWAPARGAPYRLKIPSPRRGLLRVEQLVVIPLLGVIADILNYLIVRMLGANNVFVIVALPETDMKRRKDPILNTTYIFIGSHSLKPLNNLV